MDGVGAAKLADVPITLWLAEHGLGPGHYDVVTVTIDGVVVSVGYSGHGATLDQDGHDLK